jgi:NTE family protein
VQSPSGFPDGLCLFENGLEKIMFRTLCSLLIILLLPHAEAAVHASAPPKIGLALSGGGACGIAHIGILKALEEAGIPLHMIAGVSMGSLVGGLYAAGHTPAEIQAATNHVDWSDIFRDAPRRSSLFPGQKVRADTRALQIRFEGFRADLPSAWTGGQKLSQFLWKMTARAAFLAHEDFDRLPIPFRAVTTDLLTGKQVILSHGDLSEAIQASAAVPLFFAPVQRDGCWLVDGGLLDPVPVDVLREMGADFVIAINIFAKLWPEHKLKSVIDIADQATTIMMTAAKDAQLRDADFVITPDLGDHTSMDFTRLDTLIAQGEKTTRCLLPELIRTIRKTWPQFKKQVRVEVEKGRPSFPLPAFSGNTVFTDDEIRRHLESLIPVPDTDPAPRTAYHALRTNPKLPITTHQSPLTKSITDLYCKQDYILAEVRVDTDSDTIRIGEGRIEHLTVEGNRKTKSHVILREFPLKKGKVFNLRKANRGIDNIYGSGLFERVALKLVRKNGGIGVVIRVEEREYSLARFGIRYDRDKHTEVLVELAQDNLFGLGIKLDLLGILGERRHRYRVEHRSDRIFKTYLTYTLRGIYSRHKRTVYEAGDPIGEYRDIRFGTGFSLGQQLYRFGTVSAEIKTESLRPEKLFGKGYPLQEIRSLVFRSVIDNLDRFPFPRSGRKSQFSLESAAKIFGGTEAYTKMSFFAETFHTFRRRNTLHLSLRWGTADPTLPFSELFRLGGPATLYGTHQDEFRGRQLFDAHLEYRFHIPRYYYLSLRYDAGNVWDIAKKIRLSELKHAWGAQVTLSTLLGPISLSYGRSDEGNKRIYFSAGVPF